MQSMDWQTLVARRAKKDPVAQGGWNIAMTAASAVLLLDPINNHYAEASGDRAQFGWPLDEEIEKLRMQLRPRERSQEAARDRREGPDAHPRARASPCRSASSQQPMARRKTVSGNVASPVTVFWNVEKK